MIAFKNHFLSLSLFCVVSSWGSFLISPQVDQFHQNSQTSKEVNVFLHFFQCYFFQIVPGRMGLLVTLFLSLTALLVSTINNSPEVRSEYQSSQQDNCLPGCRRHNSSGRLGPSSLLLHLRSNCCLHVPTYIGPDGSLWRRSKGCRKRGSRMEDRFEHARNFCFNVRSFQCYLLAGGSLESTLKIHPNRQV